MHKHHYTEQEADAILRKAINRQPLGDEMSREQLQSIASELGIAPQALDAAEAEWREEQRAASLRAAFEAERRAAFWERTPRIAGGIAFLFLVLFMVERTSGPPPVALAMMLLMFYAAIKTVVRGVSIYHRGPLQDRLFAQWLEDRERGALYDTFSAETYATPESGRRMRRRMMRHDGR